MAVWKQRDLVLEVLRQFPDQMFDAASIARELQLAGHDDRKRQVKSIASVLAKMCDDGVIRRVERGFYQAKP